MALPANGQYAYTYDGLKRLTTRSLSLNGNGFLTKGYTYVPGAGTNSTTMLVGGLTNQKGNTTLNSYTYTYDNVGNITAIGGTTPATYTYDSHGQMLTETVNGVTYTYTYDTYGNIRSVSDGVNTYTYTYGDSNWKDLLTAYCGQSITYDQIGNPTHWYNGNNFTWVNGRRLATITTSTGSTVASYTYDVDGLRQTKTVGGVEHRYVWQGNKLVSEYWDGKELEFFYDESGMPYAFSYKSSSSATPVFYYYVTNLQGDVVKILTASGSVVANYSYNAWGKLLSSSGTMASVNPIRYRGYYFDAETGFYYVSSRYYDPEICRFVNADGYISTGQDITSYNMFAYCGNNPVNRKDPTGQFWITALIVIAVAVVCTVSLSGCSAQPTSDVGAAQPYVDMPGSDDPTSPNCYAYAIGSPVNEQPGGTSGRTPTSWNNVNDVGKSVEADLKAKGYTVREISGPDAKVYDNEFKIALRVGTQPYAYNQYTGQLYYDYHFMRQTNTGQWAEKHGYGGASVLWDAGMTPDTIPWTLGGVPYYDSAIIYYAVGN